jgi:hypothetical protein
VKGRRPILIRLSNAWAERILTAAEHDPYVADAFGSVTDLLAPPSVLTRPRFVWRVARSRTKKYADEAKVPVGDRDPLTGSVSAGGAPIDRPATPSMTDGSLKTHRG